MEFPVFKFEEIVLFIDFIPPFCGFYPQGVCYKNLPTESVWQNFHNIIFVIYVAVLQPVICLGKFYGSPREYLCAKNAVSLNTFDEKNFGAKVKTHQIASI